MHFTKSKHYSLKFLSRIKTGGAASFFFTIQNSEGLLETVKFINDKDMSFFVVGAGSNIIISDENFNGCVLRLEGAFKSINFRESSCLVTAGAGASLIKLGNQIAKLGYPNCEYMAVIPGSVGGAVRMNAGISNGWEIKNNFKSGLILDVENEAIVEYNNADMDFGYRTSILSKSKNIFLEASFCLPKIKESYNNQAILSIKKLIKSRKAKQPHYSKTFGSTFKRPVEGKAAGWYLERVEIKGMRIGDAMVTEEHANWIVNLGAAKSDDFKKLIEIGRKRVFEKFGIWLEREVVYLPEDMIGM